MCLLVSLNKLEIDNYLNYTNSFIIGLKDFSINYYEASINEIKELLNTYQNIELFISINKNIDNDELSNLEYYLKELDKLNIKGILFYDLSILSLVKKNKLNIPLIVHQTHMITNYNICNYYLDKGVDYAYLSTEITLDEILEIKEKSNIKIMTYVIGHPIISHSKRKLLSNFYDYYKLNNDNKYHIINSKNKEDKYFILENKLGTNILTYNILNGTRAFIKLKDKIEYLILDSNLMDDTIFIKILELFKSNLDFKINDDKLIKDVSLLIGSYEGFFFTKTIYKVKNEKS